MSTTALLQLGDDAAVALGVVRSGDPHRRHAVGEQAPVPARVPGLLLPVEVMLAVVLEGDPEVGEVQVRLGQCGIVGGDLVLEQGLAQARVDERQAGVGLHGGVRSDADPPQGGTGPADAVERGERLEDLGQAFDGGARRKPPAARPRVPDEMVAGGDEVRLIPARTDGAQIRPGPLRARDREPVDHAPVLRRHGPAVHPHAGTADVAGSRDGDGLGGVDGTVQGAGDPVQVGGGGVGEHRVRPQALQGGQILDGPGVRRGGEAEPGPGRGSAHGLDAGAVQRHCQV